jgi:hypothetical protein
MVDVLKERIHSICHTTIRLWILFLSEASSCLLPPIIFSSFYFYYHYHFLLRLLQELLATPSTSTLYSQESTLLRESNKNDFVTLIYHIKYYC